MERGCILILQSCVVDAADLNPVLDPIFHRDPPYEEPDAGDHVVEHQYREEQLCEVDADEGVLALDHVVQQIDDTLKLQEAQQSQDPHSPGALEDLAKLAHTLPVVARCGRGDGEPLGANDDDVRYEPCEEVALEDPPMGRDVVPLVKVSQEKALEHVARPEEESDPVHAYAQKGRWWIEGLIEGDRYQVIADEDQTREVPGKTEGAVRVDRAAVVVLLSSGLGLQQLLGACCNVGYD
mmetsp:Transcript_29984/g.68054  ORF Transcript_29984/g.68054 Transcript_29984/m.68054 type:complete len:238 (-) Transcript_29984:462-1175(-)